MGLGYCFLNYHSPIFLCSDRFFRTLLVLFPAQHFILQFQKGNLLVFSFFFFLINNFLFFIKNMTVSFPHCVKSGQDYTYAMSAFIVSDFERVQECKYVCSWQLGLVFLAGEVWQGDFLDRITLAVSCWNVCLQEQKMAEWHAVTCLVNNQPSTEQYSTDWITRNHKENNQWEARSSQLCGRKCFI